MTLFVRPSIGCRVIPCPHCDGRGFVRTGPIGPAWKGNAPECSECYGTGEIEIDELTDDEIEAGDL